MKNKDIKGLSVDELAIKIKDARAELFNLRFQMATGQLDNTGRVPAVKKEIARLLTESRAREIAEAAEQASEAVSS